METVKTTVVKDTKRGSNNRSNNNGQKKVQSKQMPCQTTTVVRKQLPARQPVQRISDAKRNVQIQSNALASQVEKIVHATTNPKEAKPHRFRSEFSSRATAVAKPFAKFNSIWGGASDGNGQLLEGEMFGALFRSPFRAAVIYEANPSQTSWSYSLLCSDGDTVGTNFNNVNSDSIGTFPLPFVGMSTNTLNEYKPHGDVQFPGIHAGRTYLWLDSTDSNQSSLTFTFNAAVGVAGEVVIHLIRYENGQVVKHGLVSPGIGDSQMILYLDRSAYYALEVEKPAVTGIKIQTITFSATCASFGHKCAGSLDAMYPTLGNNRVLAASLMYSNTAPEMYKEGQITALQYGYGKEWYDFAFEGYDELAIANGAKTMVANEGMYGWLKPTGPSDFNLKTGVVVHNNTAVRVGYDLADTSEYVVMMAKVNNALGRNGYWTVCHHVEFETIDNWRNQKKAESHAEAYKDALLLIRDLPQFSQNANHLTAFLQRTRQLLGKGLKAVEMNVPDMVAWAVKNGPAIAKSAALLASVL